MLLRTDQTSDWMENSRPFSLIDFFSYVSLLLDRGIHPTRISDGFEHASHVAMKHLETISDVYPFSKDDIDPLVRVCMTTLSSKM